MRNEILKPVLDTDEVAVPRYDVVGPDGAVLQQNVELRLKNEVMQQGTPYDENSVLPDDLSESLDLDPKTSTPAQALRKIIANTKEGAPKIGDTLTTIRTDLGENWLLCNGENIDETAYPELYKTSFIYGTEIPVDNVTVKAIAYGDGKWVIIGARGAGTHILVAEDLRGPWTDSGQLTNAWNLNSLAYGNGVWVAAGYNTNNYPIVVTATDPTGTWTVKQITSSVNLFLRDIKYANGVWVTVGVYGTASYIYTATDPTGTWTQRQYAGSNYNMMYLEYGDGYWVCSGGYASGDYYNVVIWVTTDPTSTSWTIKTIIGSIYGVRAPIAYGNGLWVLLYNTYNATTKAMSIATDPTSSWTEYIISNTTALTAIMYNGNQWFIGDDAGCIYTTLDPETNTWISLPNKFSGNVFRLAWGNNEWVGYSNTGYAIVSSVFRALPLISSEETYTYIKAKEDEA
ncbi:MAG: hypothetical protein ACI4T5_10475 [Prevotella sp.]